MAELALSSIEKFGLPVAFLAVMIKLYVWLANTHREERKEWMKERSDSLKNQHDLQSETNNVLRELSTIIARSKRKDDD